MDKPSLQTTNYGYRSLPKERKAELLQIMIELRKSGRPLPEIAAAGGVSRYWACKLMKKAGIDLPKTIIDKNGTHRTKHGMRHTSEYSSWISMRTRCCDPNHPTYEWYGARGIKLDTRWLDFHLFLEDMGRKPAKGYTIERKDHNGNYCKDNCIWLPKRLQNRNMRTTVLKADQVISIRKKFAEGIRQYLIAKEFGIRPSHVGAIVNRKCWKDL